MKLKYILLIFSFLAIFSSCQSSNNNLSFSETLLKTTKTNSTATSIKVDDTKRATIANTNTIDIQKKLASLYEEYFNDNNVDIAIKSDSFKILKKEIVFRKKSYEIYGIKQKDAKEKAINECIDREVMYQLAINNGIKVSNKKLTSYINQQIDAAKEVQTAYLYYLKDVTIEDAYDFEKNNIYKFLCIEKYKTNLEKKYGSTKSKNIFDNQINKFKENNNIDILI